VLAKIKASLKKAVGHALKAALNTTVGRYTLELGSGSPMTRIYKVSHAGTQLTFAAPNTLCSWRAKTFATKEPETLEWIDAIPLGSVFWDIGANVGLYTVYAAKRRKCRVWAFEPSVFNLELLARNIYLNELVPFVCVVPFALSSAIGSSQLNMTTTEWGGALSTFGENYGWDGREMKKVFEFRTIGISMDAAGSLLGIPQPDFIKIDVDGIEHLILSGGESVLREVKELLIEVNDDFREQAEGCERLLRLAGLVLKHKLHSELIDNSVNGFQKTYNQIWVRGQS
jgi:FkbM family methyltransferase